MRSEKEARLERVWSDEKGTGEGTKGRRREEERPRGGVMRVGVAFTSRLIEIASNNALARSRVKRISLCPAIKLKKKTRQLSN